MPSTTQKVHARVRFFNAAPFVRARDFADYCIDAFERLWAEGVHAPKMLSIGLHTRIIGWPARIGGAAAALKRRLINPHTGQAVTDTLTAVARQAAASLRGPAWSRAPQYTA